MTNMNNLRKTQTYRDAIDELVRMCKHGQGTTGARRVHKGIWNRNASPSVLPEQHQMNLLLERLSPADRNVLAHVLKQEVVTGVFETLKVMEKHHIEPFTEGYEGSAHHDFVGRMSDWNWPEK